MLAAGHGSTLACNHPAPHRLCVLTAWCFLPVLPWGLHAAGALLWHLFSSKVMHSLTNTLLHKLLLVAVQHYLHVCFVRQAQG